MHEMRRASTPAQKLTDGSTNRLGADTEEQPGCCVNRENSRGPQDQALESAGFSIQLTKKQLLYTENPQNT